MNIIGKLTIDFSIQLQPLESFPIEDIPQDSWIDQNPIYIPIMDLEVNHHQVVFMGDYTLSIPLRETGG